MQSQEKCQDNHIFCGLTLVTSQSLGVSSESLSLSEWAELRSKTKRSAVSPRHAVAAHLHVNYQCQNSYQEDEGFMRFHASWGPDMGVAQRENVEHLERTRGNFLRKMSAQTSV